ncbi:F0F1 ATP synthase subunit epsilon [Candidatus Peregrinibacteria bacterium]|nr:F0F1 ATP synthase subunit epsilon [Candidatus Peregrinibacteria bacterium]
MPRTFRLTIRTPDENIFDEEVISVRLISERGTMTILAKHASLTASVLFSPIYIKTEKGEEEFMARRGILYISNEENKAVLLCLTVEQKLEMSYITAEEYLKFIENKLARGENVSEYQLIHLKTEKMAVEKQVEEYRKLKTPR